MDSHKQKGFLSIVAIILVVIVSLICVAATYQSVSDTRQAANSLNSAKAFYMAQSGIQYAKHQIDAVAQTCGTNVPATTFSGASGVFTVTTSLSGTQCTITSTGYVPNTTSPVGIRTIQAVFNSAGVSSAPLVASGPISLTGNATVSNPSVSASSANYAGSTIISTGTVSISGSGSTTVNGLNPSSSSSTINADVVQNNTTFNSSNLFSQFFSVPITTIQLTATPVLTENQLNSAPGGSTYFYNGDLKTTGTDTVGTAANPAILVVNGNLDIKGNFTFYGLIYVTGNLTISGNATITGAAVSQSSSITSLTGNTTIVFDSSILNTVHTINPNTVLHFYDTPASLKEIIP